MVANPAHLRVNLLGGNVAQLFLQWTIAFFIGTSRSNGVWSGHDRTAPPV